MRQRAGAGAGAEIRGLELERHRRAGERIALEACGHLFAELAQAKLERSEIGYVIVESGLGGDALGFPVRLNRTFVEPTCKAEEPRPLSPIPAGQFPLSGALEGSDGAHSIARKTLLRHLTDSEYQANRLRREEGRRLFGAQSGKSARLIEIGSDLGQELVAGKADGYRNGESFLHVSGKSRKGFGRASSMQPRCAREI